VPASASRTRSRATVGMLEWTLNPISPALGRHEPQLSHELRSVEEKPAPLSNDELGMYLDDAMLLPSDPSFNGVRWMTTLSEPMWSSSDNSSWTDLYHPLLKMLFEIGFIGFVQPSGKPVMYSYDNPDFANNLANVDNAKDFLVHPAYHLALNIKSRYIREER
jgi:hypothetical protein